MATSKTLSTAAGPYTLFFYPAKREKTFIDREKQEIHFFHGARGLTSELWREALEKLARQHIEELCRQWAPVMQVKYGRISMRSQRTRWGSCSSLGNLNFNWLLILAPTEICLYVVLHELAHLRHQDHSRAFWGFLQEFAPQWRVQRQWLRSHGNELMALTSAPAL